MANMKYAIFALLFLGACAQVDAYQAAVAYAGAKAADDALETAEWFVCKGASIGAVRRAHGQDENRVFHVSHIRIASRSHPYYTTGA